GRREPDGVHRGWWLAHRRERRRHGKELLHAAPVHQRRPRRHASSEGRLRPRRPRQSGQDLPDAEPLSRVRARGALVSAVVVRVQPADAAECARLLAEASRDRHAVRIAGGMTKGYLGDARECDLELRTTSISGIIDHVPADLTVTVAAGTRVADLVSSLARFGQFLPLDPPHAAAALVRAASRPAALVVTRGERGGWRLVIAARGDAHSVRRAISDAERESLARGGEIAPLTNELTELRELPARAVDGALVRVALPLAAQSAFAETGSRVGTFAALVADAASGIHRIHLIGDDDAVATDAEALVM